MSRITDKVFDHYPSMTIYDILYTPSETHPKGEYIIDNLYKTRFFVVGLLPNNLLEICQLFCKQCLQNFSFKQFMNIQAAPSCPDCSAKSPELFAPSELEPIFLVQFYIKDKSILNHVHP